MLRIAFTVVLVGMLQPASPAAAQARNDPKAAKAHYEKGVVLYDLQRYEEAAAEYEAAYEAKPDPALLFNCGQAWRLAGKRDKALRAYQAYLRRMPQAPNRAEVDGRIEELRAQEKAAEERLAAERAAQERATRDDAASREAQARAEEAAAVRAQAEAAAQSQRDERVRRARTLKWAGLGLGLGGVLVGVIGVSLYGAGAAAFAEINTPRLDYVFEPTTERRMNTLRPAGVTFALVGLAAAVGGWTLFGLGLTRERREQREQRAVVLPHGAFFAKVAAR